MRCFLPNRWLPWKWPLTNRSRSSGNAPGLVIRRRQMINTSDHNWIDLSREIHRISVWVSEEVLTQLLTLIFETYGFDSVQMQIGPDGCEYVGRLDTPVGWNLLLQTTTATLYQIPREELTTLRSFFRRIARAPCVFYFQCQDAPELGQSAIQDCYPGIFLEHSVSWYILVIVDADGDFLNCHLPQDNHAGELITKLIESGLASWAKDENLTRTCATCGYSLIGNVSRICPECRQIVERGRSELLGQEKVPGTE